MNIVVKQTYNQLIQIKSIIEDFLTVNRQPTIKCQDTIKCIIIRFAD